MIAEDAVCNVATWKLFSKVLKILEDAVQSIATNDRNPRYVLKLIAILLLNGNECVCSNEGN